MLFGFLCHNIYVGSITALRHCTHLNLPFLCFCAHRYVALDSRMASSSRDAGTVEDGELLLAVQSWNYRDYVRLCSDCYKDPRFLSMAVDDNKLAHFRT